MVATVQNRDYKNSVSPRRYGDAEKSANRSKFIMSKSIFPVSLLVSMVKKKLLSCLFLWSDR